MTSEQFYAMLFVYTDVFETNRKRYFTCSTETDRKVSLKKFKVKFL